MSQTLDREPMTPDRLRWALEQCGWTQNELARRLNIRMDTVHKMARGKKPVPAAMAAWLEEIACFMAALGLPANWQSMTETDTDPINSEHMATCIE